MLVNAAAGLSALFQDWDAEPTVRQSQFLIVLVSTLVPAATALLVWANADWLAVRVASVESDPSAMASWSPQEALRLGVATVGVVTLAHAIPELVWYASLFVSLNWERNTALGPMSASEELRAQFWDVSGKANFASTIGRAIVGLVMILKPAKIASHIGRGDLPPRGDAGSENDGGVQQGVEADKA
jgi:hypothetical protein